MVGSINRKENLESIVESGATWEQINELATWLLTQYGIAPEEELDEKLEKLVEDLKDDSSDSPK